MRVTQRNCNYVRAGARVCECTSLECTSDEHVFGLACTCVVTGGRGSKRRRGARRRQREGQREGRESETRERRERERERRTGEVAGRLVGGKADCTRCAVRLTACALRRRPTTLLFEKGRAKEREGGGGGWKR